MHNESFIGMKRFRPTLLAVLVGCMGVLAQPSIAAPQLPDFTYQGHLRQNGAPANGDFDLTFALYDDATAGVQVGSPISEADFAVTDGLFTVSLSFPGAFSGTQLWLQVGVDGTPLLPRQAVSTAPVAQFSLSGSIGGAAGGDLSGNFPNPSIVTNAVTNSKLAAGSVTSTKLASSSVTTAAIASFAVGNSELATDAVTITKIADSSVDTPRLADSAVTEAKLANSAVTEAKLANSSVDRGKFDGGFASGAVAVNLGADECEDFQVGVTNAQVDDLAFISMRAAGSFPADVVVWPVKVNQAGSVLTRFCNLSSSPRSISNHGIYIQTIHP